jgi:hypothetical protein
MHPKTSWAGLCKAAALLGALAVGACSDAPTATGTGTVSLARAGVAQTPRLETKTPTYPAIAVYIVYREYVNQNAGIRRLYHDDPKYQRYMEKRLRELYPQRGYAGMMREAVAEMRQYRRAWREYENELGIGVMSTEPCSGQEYQVIEDPECGTGGGGAPAVYDDDQSWSAQQEFVVDETYVPTVQEEADSLQVTSAENDLLYYYEDLARGESGYQIAATGGEYSRDELIRMAASGVRPGEATAQIWGPAITIPLSVAAFLGPRVLFSKLRAESASASYYPNLIPGDTRRDAFRHVYVNVMLRRYCSGPIAEAIMDANEWGNEAWGARVMDYHNNDLGRYAKYQHFRGHWFWDRWSWGVWGHKVRRYIDDPQNGTFLSALQSTTLTEAQARAIADPVPSAKYIFIVPDQ